MDKIISALRPGHSAELSRFGSVVVTVERSGDGKTLRFVRTNGCAAEVFKSCKY